jgi:transketolase
MLLVGAGMAASGYIPFASTFAIFTERAFEQMRNGVARPNLAVHLCGSHGGTHTGTDGSSAQSIEDLAVFRTLPNVVVLHPCDDVSTRELTKQLASTTSPSYMRTARNKTPVMYDDAEDGTIVIGKGIELKGGADVAIIACGVMVSESIKAAQALEAEGISASVIDMHTLKPLDGALIDSLVERCGALVTAEDHNVIGGLGSAVAEHLVANTYAPLEMVGVPDRFGESGQADEMLDLMNISAPYIANAARKAMSRK